MEGRDTTPSRPAAPIMSPSEIGAREAATTQALPPSDQDSVERSAGEGMVGTTMEAATVPQQHLTGPAQLLLPQAGTPDAAPIDVVIDLLLTDVTVAGTLTAGDAALMETTYRLRLPDGRDLDLRITGQVADRYTVEAG